MPGYARHSDDEASMAASPRGQPGSRRGTGGSDYLASYFGFVGSGMPARGLHSRYISRRVCECDTHDHRPTDSGRAGGDYGEHLTSLTTDVGATSGEIGAVRRFEFVVWNEWWLARRKMPDMLCTDRKRVVRVAPTGRTHGPSHPQST